MLISLVACPSLVKNNDLTITFLLVIVWSAEIEQLNLREGQHMKLLMVAPDNSALGHFANDVLVRELSDWDVTAYPVSAEDLIATSDIELEILDRNKDADLVLIWHWGKDGRTAPWVDPLYTILKEKMPKAYKVWVMYGVGEKEELAHLEQPLEGSFVIDYGDPKDTRERYWKRIKESGEEPAPTGSLLDRIMAGDDYDAFLGVLRLIAG